MKIKQFCIDELTESSIEILQFFIELIQSFIQIKVNTVLYINLQLAQYWSDLIQSFLHTYNELKQSCIELIQFCIGLTYYSLVLNCYSQWSNYAYTSQNKPQSTIPTPGIYVAIVGAVWWGLGSSMAILL